MSDSHLNIIIADCNAIFVVGLKSVLNEMPEYHCNIVGEVATAASLFELTQQYSDCLLLIDMNLPDMDGLEVLSNLKARNANVKAIMLSNYDESNVVKAAFRSGAEGYIMKSTGIMEYYKAIATVNSGQTYLGKGLTIVNGAGTHSRFLNQGGLCNSYEDNFLRKYNLTRREMEIMKLIGQALTNKEIAKELYISDQTVSVHRKNIMRKLGVSSSTNLVRMAHEYNLI